MFFRYMKIFSLALLPFLLVGCGFTPAYKHNQEKALPHNGQKIVVQLTDGGGYHAYSLKKSLQNQLRYIPKFDDHTFLIKLKFSTSKNEINYDSDATVSRSSAVSTVNYELYRMGMSVPLYKGSLSNQSSFNIDTSEEFATISAENAASDRATLLLAEDTAREIMIYLKQQSRVTGMRTSESSTANGMMTKSMS